MKYKTKDCVVKTLSCLFFIVTLILLNTVSAQCQDSDQSLDRVLSNYEKYENVMYGEEPLQELDIYVAKPGASKS